MAESTYKCGRRKGFTTVYRSVAQDSRLSLKARGLFLLLQSLPEDWNYTISGLAGLAGVGRDQIRSGLEELQEVGYLVKEQAHNEAGKFSGNVFVLQEEPPPLSGNPATGFPTTGNPTDQQVENQRLADAIAHSDDPEMLEQVARDKGFVKQGEELYIDVAN